jgi:hypothetical protein
MTNKSLLKNKPALKNKPLLKGLTYWNRKLHIHVGLFLLLFIWLFSFTGLLLNHSTWKLFSFWEEREETKTVTAIALPQQADSAAILQQVMQQLKLTGEVNNVKLTPDSLDFRVSAPGRGHNLHVDFKKGTCTQTQFYFNWWGKLRTLHTFNGIDKKNADVTPNWLITNVWRFSMDGIAIGLIFLCVSSWVMWYKIRKDYSWGPVILALGFAGAIYFVFLIRMM